MVGVESSTKENCLRRLIMLGVEKLTRLRIDVKNSTMGLVIKIRHQHLPANKRLKHTQLNP